MTNIAIRATHLSKCYHIYDNPHDRLKQFAIPRLQRLIRCKVTQYFHEFWALNDVSFTIKKGETVGIIGRNGSGKSTLLQLICGTLTPTSGQVEINGRIAALLELGSGFNPEFTGCENVYLNASVLGLSQAEIDKRFDDILAFAEIGDFINQPVKTYSSGMMVRLAFAVIAHVDADILVVDEALAVGDVFFTQKCMRFIRQYQDNGGTLLFVSHDMGTVINICQSVVMLFPNAQRKAVIGDAETLCKNYLNQIYDDSSRVELVEQQRAISGTPLQQNKARVLKNAIAEANVYAVSAFRSDTEQFGQGGATILNAGFFDDNKQPLSTVTGGQAVCFIVRVRANQAISYPAIGMMVKDRLGQFIYTEGTDKTFRHHALTFSADEQIDVLFTFTMPILIRGQYTINVAVAEGLGDDHIQHHWIHDAITIEALSSPLGHGISGFLNSAITMEFFPSTQETTQ